MPFMVSYIFRQSAQIDRLAMFHELVVFVVVPLVCGVVLRSLSQPIREAVHVRQGAIARHLSATCSASTVYHHHTGRSAKFKLIQFVDF